MQSMKDYETLIETLVSMAEITRPRSNPAADKNQQRFDRIQDGICDLMEDAAVAIDELIKKIKEEKYEERKCAEAA